MAALTQRELADALGKTQSLISRYARRGMPMDVAGAKAWLARHVQPRVPSPLDRAVKLRHPDPRPAPQRRTAGDESRPGAAELKIFNSAALFTAKFGVGRFGPLLMHVCGLLSEDAHGLIQEAHDRGENHLPQVISDAWDTMSDEYFQWLPPLSPEAKEVEWP